MKNSCEQCAFRQDGDDGAQVGCRVGRIERYGRLGLVVAEGDHFVVRDRMCGFNVHRAALPPDADLDDVAARVAAAIRVRARWVVAAGDRLSTDETVELALAALRQGDFVREVRVVVPDRKTQRRVSAALSERAQGAPWAVRWLVEPTRASDPFECVREGLAVEPTACQFVVLLWGGGLPPDDYLASLDRRVCNDLDQVSYEDHPWGAVMQTRVFLDVDHSGRPGQYAPDGDALERAAWLATPFPARLEALLKEPAA